MPRLKSLLDGLQKVANRVFSGLVLAGIVVASALLMPHRRALGTIGFILAGVMSLDMAVSILHSDHRKDL